MPEQAFYEPPQPEPHDHHCPICGEEWECEEEDWEGAGDWVLECPDCQDGNVGDPELWYHGNNPDCMGHLEEGVDG